MGRGLREEVEGGVRTGWVTHLLLNIQKVDICGTFCYTSELVARGRRGKSGLRERE